MKRLKIKNRNSRNGYLKTVFTTFLFLLFYIRTVYAVVGHVDIENMGTRDYKAVRLTPEIYSGAKNDLSDILIKDQTGNTVAYFINSAEDVYVINNENYTLRLVDSFEKNGDMYFDFYADIAEPDTDIHATSISFGTGDSTFAVITDISGSYDGMKWQFIKSDKLYNVDGNTKLAISFDNTEKYTMYRLRVKDNTSLRFSSAELKYDKALMSRIYYAEELSPAYTVEEADKETIIKISGIDNLKMKDITIETESLFKREVYCGGVYKTMYNLAFENAGYAASDLIMEMNGKSFTDELTMTIANGDDKPIEVNAVTISYYADELVFKAADTDKYILSFGGVSTDSAPSYDIEGYKDLILRDGYDMLEMESISYEQAEETAGGLDYTLIFNIVIVMVSLLLMLIIFLRIRRTGL